MQLLDPFKWGHGFISVNKELLDIYSRCKNGAEVVQAQKDYLTRCEEEIKKRRDDVDDDDLFVNTNRMNALSFDDSDESESEEGSEESEGEEEGSEESEEEGSEEEEEGS